VKRTLAPYPINLIANDPCVRPWLGFGSDVLDVSALIENPNNFALLTDNNDGAYVLVKLDQGLYCVHTLALQSARGKPMLRLMKEMFAFMFQATDCLEICTYVPDGNDNASRWADLAGFRETFRKADAVALTSGPVGASYRLLTYADWMMGKLRQVDLAPIATNDQTLNRWLDGTIKGCLDGNALKAVQQFNRWAVQGDYERMNLLSLNPPLSDGAARW